jgi:REP element-mobilizing transposase RayT
MYFHAWFSTKRRADALIGEIRDIILASFADSAARTGINLVEAEALHDHAHVLVEVRDDQTLGGVMKQLKGASARRVFEGIPELKMDMHSHSFWQRGYDSRIVPPNQVGVVRRYIRTQDERPLRHNP